MNAPRETVAIDDAIAMLHVRDGSVHTFKGGGFMLVGCDWPPERAVGHLREHGAELSGDTATAMKHGLYSGGVFFETRQKASGEP